MKRRTLLLAGLGTAGALVVGWGVSPLPQRLRGSRPLPLQPGEVELNGWVKIGTDDSVTVIVPRCEMGQGIHTGLAMVLAEELDCDWSRVRVESAPIDPIYKNYVVIPSGLPFAPEDRGVVRRASEHLLAKASTFLGVMVTGGSTSIPELWMPLRQAGATARATLLAAAAADWGVPVAECAVQSGRITHADGRQISYGALVARSAKLPVIDEAPLKDLRRATLLGRSLPRLDAPDKVSGRAVFAADVREPGMLYAAILLAPTRDASLVELDERAARALPGVRGVLRIPAFPGAAPGVAVVAEDSWRAQRALSSLQPRWARPEPSTSPQTAATDAALSAALWQAVRSGADTHVFRDLGAGAPAAPGTSISAEYEVPYLAHAAMEPLCCSIRYDGDRATVYAGVQIPDAIVKVAAAAMDLAPAAVELRQACIGGSFGRRNESDFVAQTAVIARQFPGVLVQLQWSREDDLRNDFYRPSAASRIEGSVDASGRILSLHSRSSSQSATAEVALRLLGTPMLWADKGTVEGVFDLPYRIPRYKVEHATLKLPVVIGVWRSVGYSSQAFFAESFIDELAAAAQRDPLDFRLAHLEAGSRQHAVLRTIAEKSGWNSPPAPAPDGARVARGVALCTSFGSVVAQVVEVSLAPDQQPRVHRVVAVVDCGIPVNPGLIRQQIEGSVIFGLSAALHGKVSFDAGVAREGNFDAYRLLRLAESPQIEVHIMPSEAAPTGLGEPGVPPIAPAVANALFALTGTRRRRLPLVQT